VPRCVHPQHVSNMLDFYGADCIIERRAMTTSAPRWSWRWVGDPTLVLLRALCCSLADVEEHQDTADCAGQQSGGMIGRNDTIADVDCGRSFALLPAPFAGRTKEMAVIAAS